MLNVNLLSKAESVQTRSTADFLRFQYKSSNIEEVAIISGPTNNESGISPYHKSSRRSKQDRRNSARDAEAEKAKEQEKAPVKPFVSTFAEPATVQQPVRERQEDSPIRYKASPDDRSANQSRLLQSVKNNIKRNIEVNSINSAAKGLSSPTKAEANGSSQVKGLF